MVLDFLQRPSPAAGWEEPLEETDSEAANFGDEYCFVLYSETKPEGAVPPGYHHILTASLTWSTWLGRLDESGPFFLDTASWTLEDAAIVSNKSQALSFLFPPKEAWDGTLEALYEEAKALGQAVYIDDGGAETHIAASKDSHYTWILEARNESLHPAFVRAIGQHSIPIFSGWVLFTNMFHNAVVRYPVKRGSVPEFLWQLRLMRAAKEDDKMVKYHYMIRDILTYRYRIPFPERLRAAACTLCKPRRPFAVVGVYSARRNFDKREAVRRTWGRVLAEHGISVTFFLGSAGNASSLSAAEEAEEAKTAAEAQRFGDIVRLPVPEGYTRNAQKGVEFIRWFADNWPNATFCIKVDDDIYWRPEGILRMLKNRVPFRYVWGFLDLNSPVPREKADAFFHSRDEWPDDVFPTYARGALRVLSMDIVLQLAAASRIQRPLLVTGDDPSLGVHMRQLVLYGGTFLQMDDRGANTRFSMEPTCKTEGAYCPLKNTTWVVHHVSAKTIRCMFREDLRAGYYHRPERGGPLRAPATEFFPSLCGCVDLVKRRGARRPFRLLRRERRCLKRPSGGVRA